MPDFRGEAERACGFFRTGSAVRRAAAGHDCSFVHGTDVECEKSGGHRARSDLDLGFSPRIDALTNTEGDLSSLKQATPGLRSDQDRARGEGLTSSSAW